MSLQLQMETGLNFLLLLPITIAPLKWPTTVSVVSTMARSQLLNVMRNVWLQMRLLVMDTMFGDTDMDQDWSDLSASDPKSFPYLCVPAVVMLWITFPFIIQTIS